MYASYRLVELYVKIIDLTGFTLAIFQPVFLNGIALSMKEKLSYLEKKVECRWFKAMDPATIFDPSCRKYVLFDKLIGKFAYGEDFDSF